MKIVDTKIKKIKNLQQSQILNGLNKIEQEKIINKIDITELELVTNLYDDLILNDDVYTQKVLNENYEISPINLKFKSDYKNDKSIFELGKNEIKKNNIGVVLLAAGLGTRLGHDGPKGTFELNINGKPVSLFQFFINQCLQANNLYNINIPIYILCSENNYELTVDFFKKNNYFGYDDANIIFFRQKSLPLVDLYGKIMIDDKMNIVSGPNGNGDLFSAFKRNKIDIDIKKRRLDWILITGIDNILIDLIDPIFMGLAVNSGLNVCSKSFSKPDDKTRGYVFAKQNGKFYMLENGKITSEIANATNREGKYLYRETNILYHLVSTKIINRLINKTLPYHSALKKTSFINSNGKHIVPNEPNSYKFEKFVYEAFCDEEDMLVVSIEKDEFSPLKNASGDKSASAVIDDYTKYKL